MTVLLTGYEPYGNHDVNPSAQVVDALDGTRIAGQDIVGAILPVEFARVAEEIETLIDRHDPTLVLATGLDAHSSAVAVERVGINFQNAGTTPDNAGQDPRDDPVDSSGPAAYMATIPVETVVRALLDRGIPARASTDAGTHVCNSVLYAARQTAETTDVDTQVGFLHLPLTPARAAAETTPRRAIDGGTVPASLPLDVQQSAVEGAVRASLDNEQPV